jgi:hypothetical protein
VNKYADADGPRRDLSAVDFLEHRRPHRFAANQPLPGCSHIGDRRSIPPTDRRDLRKNLDTVTHIGWLHWPISQTHERLLFWFF